MNIQTTNIRDQIELLAVFQMGLAKGFIDKSDVILWADNIIQKDEQPDYFVIELSLCGHQNINDIISLIHHYVGEPKPVVSGRVILGLAYHKYIKKEIPLRNITEAIYWLVWEVELTEVEKSLMYSLDEDLNCAENGIYGNVDTVEKEILRFIEIYKDFSIDNFAKWNGVNKGIDEKVNVLSRIVKAETQQRIKEHKRAPFKTAWRKFWNR